MTNSKRVSGRKAITSLFATILLFSAAICQGLGPNDQERDGLSVVPETANAARSASPDVVAAPALTITPISWGVVGLDSNNVTAGPSLFPVGARVCNTLGATATNVVSTFVWDSANAMINLRAGSNMSLSLPTLAAGACADLYYEVEVTRSAAAYDTTRAFRITATADTLAVASTPTPREIYVEKLVSQNRNSVTAIKLNGATVPSGGTMNLTVGNTYTIELDGSTATNGYEQIEAFINLPNVIFQTLSVSSTYTAPTGYTGNKLYEDACGWDPVPTSRTYRSCTGPANMPGGKAGGNIALTYTVKVLSGGGTSSTLNTLIYDFSGSSYHYNNDFSTTSVIARILPAAPTAAGVSVSGRATTANGNGIRNVQFVLTESDGTVHYAISGPFGYYSFDEIPSAQNVIVSAVAKKYHFSESVRLITLNDNFADLDWVSNE